MKIETAIKRGLYSRVDGNKQDTLLRRAIMRGEFFKGDVKDVLAELKAEAQRCKGIKVGVWLRLREIERAEAEQFGISVNALRRYATNK